MKKLTGLDIVDILLSNEESLEKVAPTEKRGRKKTTPLSVHNDNNANLGPAIFTALKYIEEDEWIALGRPKFGFTTAKLAQWVYRTKGYYEVLLNYHKQALNYLKLTSAIRWYDEVNDERLSLCRQEIKLWRNLNKITEHDLRYIIEICYNCEYLRKRVIRELNQVARAVFENRKEELTNKLKESPKDKELLSLKDSLSIRSVAEPLPRHKLVILKDASEETGALATDIKQAIVEAINDVPKPKPKPKIVKPKQTVLPPKTGGCSKHPTYSGMRLRASNKCKGCIAFYKTNKAQGIKEKRVYS